MDINIEGRGLLNLSRINILLGKNGSGKSVLLRFIEERKQALQNAGAVRYVTPERGGELTYQGNIETNIAGGSTWGDDIRRSNRFDNYRQLSVTEFRRLETLVLRKIEKDEATRADRGFTFDTILNSINNLLDNAEIIRGDNAGFEIVSKGESARRTPATLSSGESELISLAIEILSFSYRADTQEDKTSYLFLDEPDVHLHPDLQVRLMQLLHRSVDRKNVVVIIATHSTPILGALSSKDDASVVFIVPQQIQVKFAPIGESLRKVLPIFGAHPLSNVFNENPIFLVEGEDDERI